MNDDDDLGIDLDAWQPPPVPGGIADAVVAQMRTEHTSITTVTAIDTERRASKRLWLVAIPLVAAAIAGLVAFGIRRAPANGQGTVVAEQPMHLELGPSSAEIDLDTRVTWKRDRYRIAATQTNGAATWRVDDDDTLTIDAAVASVEATNASLRVEVKMIDAKQKTTIATSAVTAAAVALVTIVVYEGAVKVTEANGKSTQVAAGTTYQIKGPTVIEEEAPTVGASTPDPDDFVELNRQVAEKSEELEKLQQKLLDAALDGRIDPSKSKEIRRVIGELAPKIEACGDDYSGEVTATIKVSAAGSIDRVSISPSDAKPAACIADVLKTARFPKMDMGMQFRYPFYFSPPKTVCDYDELFGKGQEAFSTNNWSAAFVAYEAAYKCKADAQALKLTVASACRTKNLTNSRLYWAKLTQSQKEQVGSICTGAGITLDELNAPSCDYDELFLKGQDAFSTNQWSQALASYEAAYQCRADQQALKLAVASACRAKNVPKARTYWAKLSQIGKDQVLALCVGAGITPEQLNERAETRPTGTLRISAPAGAKVLVDGRRVGVGNVVMTTSPGKYKVTLEVGDKRHSFTVNVKAGQTVLLDKHALE
jgi:hypothetical protein